MLPNKTKAFSLIELIISLLIISLIVSVFTPVMTKGIKNDKVSLQATSEITANCQNNPNFGDSCKLCTKKYCLVCGLESCKDNKYANIKQCDCRDCTDYDENCTQCNSSGCLRCNNSPMRYVKNGKCALCPLNHYCDGVNDYASCPGEGYYCDETGIHKCSLTHTNCDKCTKTRCTKCASNYYLNSSGKCVFCTFGCNTCESATTCQKCNVDRALANGKCDSECSSVITGCSFCQNAQKCDSCSSKYYLNTSKKCNPCQAANCLKCKDNVNNSLCEVCNPGYYLSGSVCKSCSDFDSNCAVCENNKCITCKTGYHLDSNSKCISNDNKFSCSDTNFMQIGSLCVTRKNMGDSTILVIPSSVVVAQAGSDYCYSNQNKCCWKGLTSALCTNDGGYGSCNRVVCDYNAAEEICKNFNYQGLKWRLPTLNEAKKFINYSVNLFEQGLQLCDYLSTSLSLRCSHIGGCYGSKDGACRARAVWSDNYDNLNASFVQLYNGTVGTDYTLKTNAFSVRCVAEIEE